MPTDLVGIGPCPPERYQEALEVLSWRLPEPQRSWMAARLRGEADQGELDLTGLWIASIRDQVVAALMAQVLAGRTAAVWPPEVAIERLRTVWNPARHRNQIAADLVQAVLASLKRSGVRVVQALLERKGKARQAADLERGGLPRVTDLLYLARSTAMDRNDPVGPASPILTWMSYTAERDDLFRSTLEASYEGSLDMPELEGARTLDDVRASHADSGRFRPDLWQLGQVPEHPELAAILLMLDRSDRNALEVAYLGLTPGLRGRGLGRATVAHALELARPCWGRIEIAVDDRNEPARRLYTATGFKPYDRRMVHLATFCDRSTGPPSGCDETG